MARLRERIDSAEKALARLDEALAITRPTLLDRDGAIQRFEFTFEAVWKAAKDYLLAIEGIDTASPKGVIRYCREVGLLTDEEAREALNMADDRNLTVHTYNEPLAAAIFSRLPQYRRIMAALLERMADRSVSI